MERTLLALLFIAFATPGFAADPPNFECRRAEGKIVIDGKVDEAAWKKAETIDSFTVSWLREKARPAKTKTSAKLLWDDEYLYFAAELEDRDLYADIKEHDGMTWDNDVFEMFFKTSEKSKGYYEFQVSAAGTMMDMYLPSRGSGGYKRWKAAHPFAWETKVTRDGTLNKHDDQDRGWQVEGRFPWKDFEPSGGKPAAGDVWKFALCRYDYSVEFEEQELSTSAPLQLPSFHRYEDYSRLKFAK